MARREEPPFSRGETYFNGDVIDISDLTDLGGAEYEGREYEYEDSIYGSGRSVRVRVVRNMSATPVTAGQAIKPAVVDRTFHKRVNGVTSAVAQPAYVADELLPAGGVPQYDLFYVVIEGPVLAKLPTTPQGADVTVGMWLGSDAAGRVSPSSFAGATTVLAGQIYNRIGISLDTILAAATGAANVLVLVGQSPTSS